MQGFTEAPPWSEPCRIIVISDPQGLRHGRVEWLASEVDEAFLEKLEELQALAIKPRLRAIV